MVHMFQFKMWKNIYKLQLRKLTLNYIKKFTIFNFSSKYYWLPCLSESQDRKIPILAFSKSKVRQSASQPFFGYLDHTKPICNWTIKVQFTRATSVELHSRETILQVQISIQSLSLYKSVKGMPDHLGKFSYQ